MTPKNTTEIRGLQEAAASLLRREAELVQELTEAGCLIVAAKTETIDELSGYVQCCMILEHEDAFLRWAAAHGATVEDAALDQVKIICVVDGIDVFSYAWGDVIARYNNIVKEDPHASV